MLREINNESTTTACFGSIDIDAQSLHALEAREMMFFKALVHAKKNCHSVPIEKEKDV